MKGSTLIISIWVFAIAGVFFAFYDLWFDFYEETKSDRIADFIFIPFFLVIFVLLIISGVYSSIKKNDLKILIFLKELVITVLVMAFVYYFFIKVPFSGVIQFINSNFGRSEICLVEGIVLKKHKTTGRFAEYELTIYNYLENKEYLFDTHGLISNKYDINDKFNIEMKKGCLGLIYLKK